MSVARLLAVGLIALFHGVPAEASIHVEKQREAYVDCLVKGLRIAVPVAKTFEHAVFTSFLVCGNHRAGFIQAMKDAGLQDADAIGKQIDDTVAREFGRQWKAQNRK